MFGYPLQHRIAEQDLGIGRGCPVADVTDMRVDASVPGGGDHLR